MKKLNRFLYLFFGNEQWARKFIGGRWVKSKNPETEWLQWNGSVLQKHLAWPMDHRKYICEDWL